MSPDERIDTRIGIFSAPSILIHDVHFRRRLEEHESAVLASSNVLPGAMLISSAAVFWPSLADFGWLVGRIVLCRNLRAFFNEFLREKLAPTGFLRRQEKLRWRKLAA
jgi:hypothetical protein